MPRPLLRSMSIAVVAFALGAGAQRLYDTRGRSSAPAQSPVVPSATGARPQAEAPVSPPVDAGPPVDLSREPLWAYGFERPPLPGEKASPQTPPSRTLRANEDAEAQTRPMRLEGSEASYSLVDVRDGSHVIDWFPGDHPPMSAIIEHGPAKSGALARGCGSCHLPTGRGRPENAPVSGQPVAYFLRQIDDFRAGRRRTIDPRKPNTNTMIDLARAMTDEEAKMAAEYFAAIPWKPWIRVVETDRVPKTRISGNLYLPIETALTEPITGRIIEMPENEELAEKYRSPRSGFIAYVPKGALAAGKTLVTTGGMTIVGDTIKQGKTTACGTCHGVDLLGVADVPAIAGRSPSYLVRQLYDIQQGSRRGTASELMRLVVANLTPADMTAIAAYVASRPGAAARP